jgi:hypothetical protein
MSIAIGKTREIMSLMFRLNTVLFSGIKFSANRISRIRFAVGRRGMTTLPFGLLLLFKQVVPPNVYRVDQPEVHEPKSGQASQNEIATRGLPFRMIGGIHLQD